MCPSPFGIVSSWLTQIVLISTGIILQFAGILKAYALSSSTFIPREIYPTKTVAAGAVLFEILLGVWLCSGVFARSARMVAAVTFGVFLTINTVELTNGLVLWVLWRHFRRPMGDGNTRSCRRDRISLDSSSFAANVERAAPLGFCSSHGDSNRLGNLAVDS